jgi:hypothetical protein
LSYKNRCAPNLGPQIKESQQRLSDHIENDPTHQRDRNWTEVANHFEIVCSFDRISYCSRNRPWRDRRHAECDGTNVTFFARKGLSAHHGGN